MNEDVIAPTTGALEFLLELPDASESNIMELLKVHAAKGKEASRVYATKATTGIPNAHAHRYTKE